MSITAPITLEWLNAATGKFKAYNISADALALINKSETLKADIRDYASNDHVAAGRINPKTGAGEYNTYVPATVTSAPTRGFLNIAADRFSTAEGTFNVLAHELGHFRVEEPGAAIANARANALARGDKVAYEYACNLTEGYAHYNEVKARDEVLAANRAQAAAEGRPLSMREQLLEDRWSGIGPFATSPEGKDHNILKGIEDAAAEYGQPLTVQDIANAAAFALGENNKSNITSTTSQTYLEFCRNSANGVISSGATPPVVAPVQEQLETTYNADGSVATSAVTVIGSDNDKIATVFDGFGRTTQVTEIDGAQNNADYSTRFTAYDSNGQIDFTDFYRDDGTRDRSDNDQSGSQNWTRLDSHFDVQGREDYRVAALDDGSKDWIDFDQSNVRGDSIWASHFDAQNREDWRSVTQDNGSRDWTDFDQSNVRGDSIWASHFDAQNREDWRNVTQDNGSHDWTDFDQSNVDPGSRWEVHYDAQGRKDTTRVVMDDNSVTSYDYDQDGSLGWARIVSQYDALGREDFAVVYLDDGSQDQYDNDQNGTQSWSRVASHHDAQAREDYATVSMDDGTRSRIDFDQDGSQSWNTIESRYDVQGREDYTNVFGDGGNRTHVDYDQDNAQAWNRVEQYFDGFGRAITENVVYDDGSRTLTDYNASTIGYKKLTIYNSLGMVVHNEYVPLASGGHPPAPPPSFYNNFQPPSPFLPLLPDPYPNVQIIVGPLGGW